MKRIDRLRREYRGEWNYGGRIAGRLYVYDSPCAVIRACWRAIKPGPIKYSREMRDARHALYRGALAAQERERKLVQAWRL